MIKNHKPIPPLVKFILLDEATRVPAGKRQEQPMQGFRRCYQGSHKLRGSDGPLRRMVCIDLLKHRCGMATSEAAACVANELGWNGAKDVEAIRTEYYATRKRRNSAPTCFESEFLSWRQQVFESTDEQLNFSLDWYGRECGSPNRRRLAALIGAIRSSRVQESENREYLLAPAAAAKKRVESNRWKMPLDWQWLATDLWTLGRIHAKIGEGEQARKYYDRALETWERYGYLLPHVRPEAIKALEAEINSIRERIREV